MKLLRVLCVLALVALFAGAAYAETQSVKVSGDLSVTGITRSNYDLRSSGPESAGGPVFGRSGFYADSQNPTGAAPGLYVPQQRTGSNDWIMSTVEVQIDADLTDNVSTCIRLLNQRDWNVRSKEYHEGTPVAGLSGSDYYGGAYGSNTNEFDVGIELAYVTLKEFIYCPLTVTIGRQNLWFGKGFIVGANLDNQANMNLTAPEMSKDHAFDAIKAVLDYDPWTITGVYAKLWENAVGDQDDVNLYGLNVGYKFDSYKAEAEAYWFFKQDTQNESWYSKNQSNDVHTVGLRGSFDPIDVITLSAEAAYQFGQYFGDPSQPCLRDRSAWALDLASEFRYFTDKCSWKPKLGLEYIMYSGNKDNSQALGETGTYTGWDPMYRGKFDSHIREWVGRYYYTYDYPARTDFQYPSADASYTNQNQLVFSASVTPVESLTLRGNYNLFWTYAPISVTQSGSNSLAGTDGFLGPGTNGNGRSGFIGSELDLMADWAYTEDVTFSVLGAWFLPSRDVYTCNNNAVATDLLASVSVSF